MRIIEVTESEFLHLPGLRGAVGDRKQEKESKARWTLEKEKAQPFEQDKHWLFSGGQTDQLSRRKKELMQLLKGQPYYENGNKVVVQTAVPGMRMELEPNGNHFRASLKNDRGAVKAELSSVSSKEDLLRFMKEHDVSAPSFMSKQHSQLENPHKHKGLAREI